jgi:integrase
LQGIAYIGTPKWQGCTESAWEETMKVDLSDRFIAGLKSKAIATDYFDTKARGLNLRVTPNGVKAWSVMFTSPRDGKRARLSLGTYPATALATARTRAIEARSLVEDGKDPRGEKKREQGGPEQGGPMTVAMLADDYLAKHASKLRSHDEVRRKMHADILPVIGKMKLVDLHRRDVHRVLDPIKERGSLAMAEKVYTDLRAMLNWAVKRGLLDSNPAAGMEEGGASKPRERYLTEEEIAALWPALSMFKQPVELALKLALVTGQRIGEVCGMTMEELDLAKAIWTIPAERSKNGKAHTVPLSGMALQLIAEAKPINGRLINRSSEAIAQALLYRIDKLPVQDWTAHDLRRSVCTHLAMMGFSPLVIGSVVNHRQVTKGGVTLGVYVQYDYAREKRQALEAWAERLSAIVSGDASKIIPLRPVDAARN